MILFENAAAPSVRAGELDLAGRRVAVRAVAAAGETGAPRFRFDPIERRLVSRRTAGTVAAGPASPQAWAAALAKGPAGAALVEGSAGAAEEIRGAFAAAARGALDSGRGVYLLDPPPAGLPSFESGRTGAAPYVALFAWAPEGLDASALAAAAAAGIPTGVVWPVVPGWTADEDRARALLRFAVSAGASFAAAVAPVSDADFRKAAVAAREAVDPGNSDAFFDVMFHRPWEEELPGAVERAVRVIEAARLAPRVPRPASPREPAANARAAARLEDRASESRDEHRASRLHAAARWIDGCGRDIGVIWKEGNLARAFPFGPELAREVEEALRESVG